MNPWKDIWADLRFALRLMIRAPWLTLAAAVPLALRIGANATVFTLVNAVLLRGLPFEDSDRIVALWTENPAGQRSGLSHPDYADLREEAGGLTGLAVTLNSTVNVSDDAQAPDPWCFWGTRYGKPATARTRRSSDRPSG